MQKEYKKGELAAAILAMKSPDRQQAIGRLMSELFIVLDHCAHSGPMLEAARLSPQPHLRRDQK